MLVTMKHFLKGHVIFEDLYEMLSYNTQFLAGCLL